MTHALILGGTRGIGRGLAARCLERGMAVTVCGRDVDALRGSAIEHHPGLRAIALDVGDAQAVRDVVAHAGSSLDLLVVTAGLYFNTRAHRLDEAETLRLLRTNVSGLAHAFEAGAERLLAQGHGRMAAVSSMAGLLKEHPGASVYGATKRSVLSLCDTYRKALAPFGIAVTAVIPGYVDTERLRELNDGDARHKPFLMPEAEAIARILAALDAGRPLCAFPWQMRVAVGLLNLVPRLRRVPDFPAPRRPDEP
ncbi:MAG: SDR family NAD(P)-dependent oxidoreductase [Betaproteobacteria bacterium]